MNRIGLTGPHKSGKTTLAKAFAKRWEMKYVDMRTSDVLRAFGVTPNEEIPFARRLEVQNNLVRHYINLLTEADDNYITDRTFIDIAAMTLSFMPHTVSDIESTTLQMHIDQCYRAQGAFFDHTILLNNAFDVSGSHDDLAEKARYNWSWNFQLETLMKGLVLAPAMKSKINFIGGSYTNLDKRIERLEDLTSEMRKDSGLKLH